MDNPFELLIQEMRELKAIIVNSNFKIQESEPVYLKVDAAAAFLSTSPNALRVMVSKQQIPYIKKQTKLFFRQSDLIAWLESGSSSSDEENIESHLSKNKRKVRVN